METRKYFLTLVLKADLPAEEAKKSQKLVTDAVAKQEGKIGEPENLGVKSLVYPMEGASQARFMRFALELPTSAVGSIRQELEKSRRFLRVMFDKENK